MTPRTTITAKAARLYTGSNRFFAKQVLKDPNSAQYAEKSIRQEKLQDLMVFHTTPLPENALKTQQIIDQWIAMAKKQADETSDPAVLRERLRYSIGAEWPAAVEGEIQGERIVMSRPEAADRVPGIYLDGRSHQHTSLPRG